MELSFKEIKDWQQFQNLVGEYFRKTKSNDKNILSANVLTTGKGPDGGRDLLVIFKYYDGIIEYERKWVVQCKFHDSDVGLKDIADVNIPSLVHQYNADGYLLITKQNVSNKVTELLEDLTSKCKFKYHYAVWVGDEFKARIIGIPKLHKQYFPKYYNSNQKKKITAIRKYSRIKKVKK